jgi:cytochrome c-type biogenesis protein CcmH/NrfG
MIKTTCVAILLLFSGLLPASPIDQAVQQLESDWAKAYYNPSKQQQQDSLNSLIERAKTLNQQHPNSAEVKIWYAVLLSTQAANLPPFEALSALDKAKSLLEQSIKQKPAAMAGAAYVTLGTLYFMTPGWPVSFGDDQKAEKLLLKGLQLNPEGIDSNYFYARFLLEQGKEKAALDYLKRALNAPLRQNQQFADLQLKKEVLATLQNNQHKKLATLLPLPATKNAHSPATDNIY